MQKKWKELKFLLISMLIIGIMGSTLVTAIPVFPKAVVSSEVPSSNTRVYQGDETNSAVRLALQTFDNAYQRTYITMEENANPFERPGKIIIFAHGNEDGLVLNHNLIRWEEVATMIMVSPADQIYLMACFSNNVFDYLGSNQVGRVIGLNGMVDAVIAGVVPGVHEATSAQAVYAALDTIVERLTSIQKGEADPQFLAKSESGYRFAIKRESLSGFLYAENVLWMNLDKPTGDTYFFAGTAGITLLIAVLVAATSLTGPVGAVISAIIILFLVTIRLTSVNRVKGDYKFGIGAQILLIPGYYFWYDYGNDNYGFDGKFRVSVGTLGGVIGEVVTYAAFGLLPTTWSPIQV